MIRLLLLLSATMFLTLLIGGQDRGQLRQGLIAAAEPEPTPATETALPVATQGMPAPLDQSSDPQVTLAAHVPLSPARPALDEQLIAEPALFTDASPADGADLVQPASLADAPQPEIQPATFAELSEPDPLPLLYVNSAAINVRQGPSTDHAVIGRLTRNEAVLVVEPELAGWVRIRIEGDGVEGFVAARLMTERDPAGN